MIILISKKQRELEKEIKLHFEKLLLDPAYRKSHSLELSKN